MEDFLPNPGGCDFGILILVKVLKQTSAELWRTNFRYRRNNTRTQREGEKRKTGRGEKRGRDANDKVVLAVGGVSGGGGKT